MAIQDREIEYDAVMGRVVTGPSCTSSKDTFIANAMGALAGTHATPIASTMPSWRCSGSAWAIGMECAPPRWAGSGEVRAPPSSTPLAPTPTSCSIR